MRCPHARSRRSSGNSLLLADQQRLQRQGKSRDALRYFVLRDTQWASFDVGVHPPAPSRAGGLWLLLLRVRLWLRLLRRRHP